MAKQVIAEQSAVIGGRNEKGRRTRSVIREGRLYRSDDPLVRGREHLFRTVEDTSAEPGAKRSVPTPKRAPKKKAADASTSTATTASSDDGPADDGVHDIIDD